jgi:hypothetical protein
VTSSGTSTGPTSGATSGTVVGSGATSGATTGLSSGATSGTVSSGATSGVEDGGSVTFSDAAMNNIPSGYTGTPFAVPTGHSMTIPGTIHLADYDEGGAGLVYCHSAIVPPTVAMCGGFNTTDWRPAGTPIYRPVPAGDKSGTCNGAACDDNAGLCHMNNGEPDRDPAGNLIMPQDVYPCYTDSGEWLKFTVTVTEAGTFSVSGLMGSPRPDQNATPTVSLDFGTVNGTDITTGTFTVPPSECDPGTGCTEGYHVWQTDNNMATVTIPAPGTYLMTFTLVTSFLNPDYFVFTKM